jgi:hypothetical protein
MALRRRPARALRGRAGSGYSREYEVVCCDCGDDPALDYREVSPALQRIRGPYTMAAGVTAYVKHTRLHPGR